MTDNISEEEVKDLIIAYFGLNKKSDISNIKELDLSFEVFSVCHSEGWDVMLSQAVFVGRKKVLDEIGGVFCGRVAERLSKALLTIDDIKNDETKAGASFPMFNIECYDGFDFNPESKTMRPEVYHSFLRKMKSEMIDDKDPQYFFFDLKGFGNLPVVFVRKGEEEQSTPFGDVHFEWPLKNTVTCFQCDEKFFSDDSEAEEAYLYDSPDHDGETRLFCSSECYDNCINASEFGYFTCDKCERTICCQFTLNGYYSFVRQLPELEETFCEACYNDRIFRFGQSFSPESDLRPETYGNPDLMSHGFEKDCVTSSDMFVETARGLINDGFFVIAVENYCFGSAAHSPTAISLWKKLNPVLVDGMEFKAKDTKKVMKLQTYSFSPEVLERHGFEFYDNFSGQDGREIYMLKESGKCVIVNEQENGPNQLWCKNVEPDQKVEQNIQDQKSKKRLFE